MDINQLKSAEWTCAACGETGNTGKFCTECAKPKPKPEWACACGGRGNTDFYCLKCGSSVSESKLELNESRNGKYYLSDDMRYNFLENEDKKTVMSTVEKTLLPNQRAYPRFRVGNIAFVEISTSAPQLTDSSGSRKYAGVILGDEPRLVSMPNKELFTHFAKIVRADPGIMEPSRRIRAALILATGDESRGRDKDAEPTWTDENGVLIIKYRVLRGGMLLWTEARMLIVDENQDFTIEKV
ncbi:MAG: hypothetical protein FWD23_10940 [Oscillospiraceae bacterium]|nr:hypothetical protein [Oscillospiraceae bacterium]